MASIFSEMFFSSSALTQLQKARKARLHKIVLHRDATLEDILKADFGIWPPCGLDLAVSPKQPVQILSHLDYIREFPSQKVISLYRALPPPRSLKKKIARFKSQTSMLALLIYGKIRRSHCLFNSAAFVRQPNGVQERETIYIHPFLHDTSSLGHEAIHLMQFDHRGNIVASNNQPTKATSISDILWENLPLKLKQKRDVYYFGDGAEIQARMHSILALGHHQWGRIPLNTEELWAAMIAGGLTPPNEILKKLTTSPQGRKSLTLFSRLSASCEAEETLKNQINALTFTSILLAFTSLSVYGSACLLSGSPLKGLLDFFVFTNSGSLLGSLGGLFYTGASFLTSPFKKLSAGKEIDKAQNALPSVEKKLFFWENTLPNLYGNLLEMYGDRKGRARLGLGYNRSLKDNWLFILREGEGTYEKKDFKKWAKALNTYGCQTALQTILADRKKNKKKNDETLIRILLKEQKAQPKKKNKKRKQPSPGETFTLRLK